MKSLNKSSLLFILIFSLIQTKSISQLPDRDQGLINDILEIEETFSNYSRDSLIHKLTLLWDAVSLQSSQDTVLKKFFVVTNQICSYRELYALGNTFQKKLYKRDVFKNDLYLKGKLSLEIASYHYKLNEIDSSNLYLENAMEFSKSNQILRVMGDAYLLKALNSQSSNDQSKAITYFIKADSLYIIGQNNGERGNVYFNLANSYYMLDDLDNALKYFNLAAEYHGQDSYDYAFDKQAVGVVLIDLDSLEQAEKVLLEVDHFLTETPVAKSTNLVALQSIQYRQGKYEKSLKSFEKNLGLKGNSVASIELAILALLEINSYARARQLFEESKELLYENKLAYTSLKLNLDLYQYQGINGRKTFTEYVNLKDSLHYQNISDNARELNEKYQSSLKQAENEKLQHQNELQEAQLKTQKAYILGGGGAALLLGLLASLFYRQRRKQEQYNETLKAQNQKIDMLKREAIHRTNNHLNLATNLIAMQKSIARKTGAQEVIEDSERKLRAIAAANKRLSDTYDNHNNLKEVIDETVGYNIFNVADKKISYTSHVDQIAIDKSYFSIIALIVNELTTNSIKHAFHHEPSPSISVTVSQKSDDIILTYQDNGDFQINPNGNEGTALIEGLVDQLDGEMKVEAAGGYRFTLRF